MKHDVTICCAVLQCCARAVLWCSA